MADDSQSSSPPATTRPVTAVKMTSDITRGFSSWKKSSGWAIEIAGCGAVSVIAFSKSERPPLRTERAAPDWSGPVGPV